MSSSQNDHKISAMFERIVPWYDTLNTVLSLGIDRLWRKKLVYEVRPFCTGKVLDLAAGTLKVSLALRRKYPSIIVPALDFCPPMLVQGKKHLHGQNTSAILPVGADARCLPLKDASVDAITMAFGIRNINPRHEAFQEMLRVLVPGGRACILEFGSGKNKIWGGLYNFYLKYILPRIGNLVSGDDNAYTYLAKTIHEFPTAVELEEEMRTAGFNAAWHISLSGGIVCLHIAEKARV